MKTGRFTVRLGDEAREVTVHAGGGVEVDGTAVRVSREAPNVYRAEEAGVSRRVYVVGKGERRQVFVDGEVYELSAEALSDGRKRGARAMADLLSAPMPARVTAIAVEAGQGVRKGDVLVKLEAMKMEMAVRAPRDGTISRIACRVGDLVQPGVGLLEFA